MSVMKDLNQYLKLRGSHWYYVRRVPAHAADVDPRRFVKCALKTQSLEVARARRDAMSEADNQYWASLVCSGSYAKLLPLKASAKKAIDTYQRARRRAMSRGFVYTPINDLAEFGDVADILARLQNLTKDGDLNQDDANAVLGAVEPPPVRISEALELYCEEMAVKDLLGKSDTQKKSWRKVKLRAVNNFIDVIGDLPMKDVSREDARRFYNWWAKRLQPEGNEKPLTPNSANRDLGNLRKLYREYWEYQGEEGRENPFRNLNFGNHGLKDIPHFENDWVRQKLLNPHVFEGLNAQASLLVYAMIETGCRPSELANLLPEDICLADEVPHIRICAKPGRQLKTETSIRDIPLVGVSLEAFKRAPNGFAHYRDKGNLLSASLMKAFRTRGLFPTEDHRIYSFRHSFEKRMLESGLDFGLRCTLMGHKNSRPVYGDGGSLEYRKEQLLRMVHPVPDGFLAALPSPD